MAYRDLAKHSATVDGTGPFTPGAVAADHQSMTAGRAAGATMDYAFKLGAAWEVGIGTLQANGTISRAPTASSNGGALVNFPAGTGELRETVTAASLNAFAVVRDIPFATAIPLTRAGAAYMADKTVNGALTFTAAAGAVRGALVYLRMTADGANLPNFSAFKEWGGSSGYDNRNGIVNQVQFFYDGADLFYSASQAVGAAPTGGSGGSGGAAPSGTTRLSGVKSGDVTESASAPWTYTSAGGATGASGAVSAISLPTATDGEVIFKVVTQSGDFMVAVQEASSLQSYADAGVQSVWSNGGNGYKVFGVKGATSAVPAASGDWIRFKKFNSNKGNYLIDLEWAVSKDSGATWTVIGTNDAGVNGLRTQPLYIRAQPGSGAMLSVISQTGFA